jgi:hypothetical protein
VELGHGQTGLRAQMQLSGETCASKRKKKKEKRLSFPFFYFSESLFFNELLEKK